MEKGFKINIKEGNESNLSSISSTESDVINPFLFKVLPSFFPKSSHPAYKPPSSGFFSLENNKGVFKNDGLEINELIKNLNYPVGYFAYLIKELFEFNQYNPDNFNLSKKFDYRSGPKTFHCSLDGFDYYFQDAKSLSNLLGLFGLKWNQHAKELSIRDVRFYAGSSKFVLKNLNDSFKEMIEFTHYYDNTKDAYTWDELKEILYLTPFNYNALYELEFLLDSDETLDSFSNRFSGSQLEFKQMKRIMDYIRRKEKEPSFNCFQIDQHLSQNINFYEPLFQINHGNYTITADGIFGERIYDNNSIEYLYKSSFFSEAKNLSPEDFKKSEKVAQAISNCFMASFAIITRCRSDQSYYQFKSDFDKGQRAFKGGYLYIPKNTIKNGGLNGFLKALMIDGLSLEGKPIKHGDAQYMLIKHHPSASKPGIWKLMENIHVQFQFKRRYPDIDNDFLMLLKIGRYNEKTGKWSNIIFDSFDGDEQTGDVLFLRIIEDEYTHAYYSLRKTYFIRHLEEVLRRRNKPMSKRRFEWLYRSNRGHLFLEEGGPFDLLKGTRFVENNKWTRSFWLILSLALLEKQGIDPSEIAFSPFQLTLNPGLDHKGIQDFTKALSQDYAFKNKLIHKLEKPLQGTIPPFDTKGILCIGLSPKAIETVKKYSIEIDEFVYKHYKDCLTFSNNITGEKLYKDILPKFDGLIVDDRFIKKILDEYWISFELLYIYNKNNNAALTRILKSPFHSEGILRKNLNDLKGKKVNLKSKANIIRIWCQSWDFILGSVHIPALEPVGSGLTKFDRRVESLAKILMLGLRGYKTERPTLVGINDKGATIGIAQTRFFASFLTFPSAEMQFISLCYMADFQEIKIKKNKNNFHCFQIEWLHDPSKKFNGKYNLEGNPWFEGCQIDIIDYLTGKTVKKSNY